MNPVVRKIVADIRRRKVQTGVVALVVFLSSLTATLALTLLVETDAPFDRAFDQVQGAHLLMMFDTKEVTQAQLRATGVLVAVSAAGGPWLISPASIALPGGRIRVIPIAGRDQVGGSVDRLTLDSGRYVQRLGEVVLSRQLADETRLGLGDTLTAASDSPLPSLHVVGIATALSNEAAAWVVPSQLPLVATAQPPQQYLMAYRLHQAPNAAEIASAVDAITRTVPAGAVVDASNYLDTKLRADRTTSVMIPFLLAFSAFALLASVLIVANLVAGAVIAGTRDIGIMKSVGFTPAQVVRIFAGQLLVPAGLGCVLGLPAGVLLSQPFLSDTAHAFGLPRTFALAPGIDLLGLAVILLAVVATTVLASFRAGRQSAAAAIAAGSAPSMGRASRLAGLAGRLPAPRALTLGFGESLSRPVRSTMTVAAILIGVATVTFAVGLHDSLTLVASALTRDHQVQVQVFRNAIRKSQQAGLSAEQATALIAAQPATARFVGIGHADANVPGAGHPVPVFAYQGDASWLGYLMIHGRWFAARGEAVAPTAFFTRTGYRVGDSITASLYGQPMPIKLVGEIFDQQGDDILLRTGMETLPRPAAVGDYEIQLRPGSDPSTYARMIELAGTGLSARLNRDNGIDTAFLLINSVLAGLAAVLVLIAASGVFNTVVLNSREKARDIAILKAIGMAPWQVVTMVLASVAVFGIGGGILGIPAGIALHRNIVILMGQIATSTGIPDQVLNVFGVGLLLSLAAAGIVIAMLGAMVPAQWAARSRVTEVLQTE